MLLSWIFQNYNKFLQLPLHLRGAQLSSPSNPIQRSGGGTCGGVQPLDSAHQKIEATWGFCVHQSYYRVRIIYDVYMYVCIYTVYYIYIMTIIHHIILCIYSAISLGRHPPQTLPAFSRISTGISGTPGVFNGFSHGHSSFAPHHLYWKQGRNRIPVSKKTQKFARKITAPSFAVLIRLFGFKIHPFFSCRSNEDFPPSSGGFWNQTQTPREPGISGASSMTSFVTSKSLDMERAGTWIWNRKSFDNSEIYGCESYIET